LGDESKNGVMKTFVKILQWIFLNNQTEALIIPILFCYKIRPSRFRMELQFHPDSESGHQNLHENYQFRMYSRKPLMMGREDARNM
jgi:hypothetical protein